MEEFAHDGHLTATARKTRVYLPYHWYLVAIETAFSPGDPEIIPGDNRNSLEPLLRVYEGCARAYLGEVEGANLIKLHRHSGKASYLVYPDFATDPHPALLRSLKLSLRTRDLDCYDLNDEHQSPHSPRQGSVPSARAPAPGQIRPADPAGGKTRAARRDGDDRHARGGKGGWRSGGPRFGGTG